MDAERYKKLDQLFDAALEVETSALPEFLDRACGDDLQLRRELESLLKTYHKLGNFIDTPALEVAAQALARDGNESFIGRQFGHYHILSALGAGGMGEVYLAQDSRMGRKLALKILPPHFTRDADRLARFQREARAASALNHPNIITIYEIGQQQGIHFIASEYIEGDTLRKRISRGKLTVKESLEIASQVAGALSAAHQAGIIHRDIKPENIMIRRDGYIKVLDFGLVKLIEADEGDSQVPANPSTQSGALLGTVNYMSPEQALGESVDQRSDIFSLGVVLYEMVTGQSPFKGATVALTFDAILNKQPGALSSSQPQVSAGLDRIIERALEKDRELRYQTAADLRAALRRLQRNLDSEITASAAVITSLSSAKAAQAATYRWKRLALALSLALLLLLTLASYFLLRKPQAEATRWEKAAVARVTDQQGEEFFPGLSPDGKSLVYASRASGDYDIYSKRVGSRRVTNLTEGSGAQETQPVFSHDGKRIAFRRTGANGGGIYVMSESGESVRQLTSSGFNPSWSPDDKEIVYAQNGVEGPSRTYIPSQMWIVNATSGESRLLFEGDAVQPSWSPGGRRIAYWGMGRETTQRDIFTIAAEGGEPVAVTSDAAVDINPVWSADGRFLYFISSRNGAMSLWRVAIEEASGKVMGEPELVPTPSSRLQQISMSSGGRHLAFVQANSTQNIERIGFDPVREQIVGEAVAVTHFSSEITAPAISPDGSILAFQTLSGNADILTLPLARSFPNSVTDDEANDLAPVWSPDGKHLAYYSNKSGVYQIWMANPDGSGAQQLTQAESPGVVLPIWSPDGSRLAYSIFGGKTYLMDLRKPWSEQTPIATPSNFESFSHLVARSWSPDGKYLAGTLYEKNARIKLCTYEIATGRIAVIADFGTTPRWLNDRRLLFLHEDKLFISDLQGKGLREIGSFAPKSLSGLDISRDGRSLFISAADAEADIWLLSLE